MYLIVGFVSYNKSLIGFKTSYFWIFGKIAWIIDLNLLNLDLYLSKIPDQPSTRESSPEAKDINGDPSKSILDWPCFIDITSLYPDDHSDNLVL